MIRLGVLRFVYSGRTKKEESWEDGADFLPFEQLLKVTVVFWILYHILQVSDFVLVTCAFSPELQHLFNSKAFDLMKSSSILINTSRGGIINQVRSVLSTSTSIFCGKLPKDALFQDDLVSALKEGKIFAAGLDVMTPEPLPTDHPLAKLDNCVLVRLLFLFNSNHILKCIVMSNN